MVPDLKNKSPYLLTLVPTLFWATFLTDFNPIVLAITLVGAVLSGTHLAIVESINLIPKDENVEKRYHELLKGKVVGAFFSVVGIYSIITYAGLVYFVITASGDLRYYQWVMIIVMIILAVAYCVGMLISKEKRAGFHLAANLGEELIIRRDR